MIHASHGKGHSKNSNACVIREHVSMEILTKFAVALIESLDKLLAIVATLVGVWATLRLRRRSNRRRGYRSELDRRGLVIKHLHIEVFPQIKAREDDATTMAER
jgi:hypothetical protein